ncbi:MAG: esterase-like activity of phytase family protein [Planctomycetota bacterium]|nr:esterase-like activity of phytase family protein [Planctomycetota bacterium]
MNIDKLKITIALVVLFYSQLASRGDWNAELVAVGRFSGASKDAIEESQTLEEGTPSNQLGGFSAIEYSGKNSLFWVLSDRGPADGAASYPCRMHLISLELDANSKIVQPKVIKTILLKDESGKPLLGSLSAVPKGRHERGQALDPEGLRLLPDGDFAISDEYGPAIDRFFESGARKGSFSLPRWMDLTRERSLADAAEGAMPNRGLEGLALNESGTRLLGVMQGPLIQDSYPVKEKRYGKHARIVEMGLDGTSEKNQSMNQYLYPLTDVKTGISEILAVDSDRYLILERDSEKGKKAVTKAIYLIDLKEATDVAGKQRIPSGELPSETRPVSKTIAINLLDDRFGWNRAAAPEKPEGLAWGPRMPDGRRSLWVCFDNDFQSDVDSLFFLFAIEDSAIQRPIQETNVKN